jgi:hypothetical protein
MLARAERDVGDRRIDTGAVSGRTGQHVTEVERALEVNLHQFDVTRRNGRFTQKAAIQSYDFELAH